MRKSLWSSAACVALWSLPATAEVKSTTCYCGIQLQGSVSNAACIRACGGREGGPREGDQAPWRPEKPPPPPPPPPPNEASPGLRDEGGRLAAAAAVGVRSALRDIRTVRLARAAKVLRAAGGTTAGRAAVFVAPRLLGVAGSVLLAYDVYRIARNFYQRRERRKPKPDPAESRYGLCTEKQHGKLQRRVRRGECSKPRNCREMVNAMKAGTSVLDWPESNWRDICTALRQRIDMFRQCIQDREVVMRTCYRKQPKESRRWREHAEQIRRNRVGIDGCNRFLAQFDCPGP